MRCIIYIKTYSRIQIRHIDKFRNELKNDTLVVLLTKVCIFKNVKPSKETRFLN